MKKFFLLLILFISVLACKKDDENKPLTPAEQEEVDQEQIMEYMKTYKLEGYHVGQLPRHIDWKIVPMDDDEPEDTQSLYDLMKDNVIEEKIDDVNCKMYYYIIDKGAGGENSTPKADERIYVDYNVFRLHTHNWSDRIDYTEFNILDFVLNNNLYKGWNLGLPKFNSGDTKGLDVSEYRKKTITPGRGILIIPSSLANHSGVLRFDIVLYHNEDVKIEE
jgi:hypothetical protein